MSKYNFKLQILITLCMLINLSFQEIDFSQLKCVDEDNNKTFSRGDTITFCIHFVEDEGSIEFAQRISYLIEVDKYIALNLENSFDYWFKQRQNIDTNYSVIVQAQNSNKATSPSVQYLGKINSKDMALPLNNAVITIDQGQITMVQWDNGCFTTQPCDKSLKSHYLSGKDVKQDSYSNNYVEMKNCFSEDETVKETAKGSEKCGLQIFVSWLGTDQDGNYMTSAGLRMSRFANYNGAELWANSQKYFS